MILWMYFKLHKGCIMIMLSLRPVFVQFASSLRQVCVKFAPSLRQFCLKDIVAFADDDVL